MEKTDRIDHAREMLNRLDEASCRVGLKINMSKTQYMTNLVPSQNIIFEGGEIE